MHKKNILYLILISSLFIFCSCADFHNVNLFENWEISEKLKKSVKDHISNTGKIVIFDETKTYIPAEKIFVQQAVGGGAGLVYVCSKHYDYIDGFEDRYDNLALFIYSDYLYDGQVIDVKASEEVKQIGVYTYRTVNKEYEQYKTVPIVILVNEEIYKEMSKTV